MLQPECSYEDTKRPIPEILKRLDDSRDKQGGALAALDTVTALVERGAAPVLPHSLRLRRRGGDQLPTRA